MFLGQQIRCGGMNATNCTFNIDCMPCAVQAVVMLLSLFTFSFLYLCVCAHVHVCVCVCVCVFVFICLFVYVCVCFQNPIIPPTITDQIRLWEIERNRLQFEDGT